MAEYDARRRSISAFGHHPPAVARAAAEIIDSRRVQHVSHIDDVGTVALRAPSSRRSGQGDVHWWAVGNVFFVHPHMAAALTAVVLDKGSGRERDRKSVV